MKKFTNELKRMHGLVVPTNPTKQWLKDKWLDYDYVCRCCGKKLDIHTTYSSDDDRIKMGCKRCVVFYEHPDEIDDWYPIMGTI